MPSVSIPFNQLCGLQVSVPLDRTSLSGTPFRYNNVSNCATQLPFLNEGSTTQGSINIETGEDEHGRPVIRLTASPNVGAPAQADRSGAITQDRSSMWGASSSTLPASSLDNYGSASSSLSSALLFQETHTQPTDASSSGSSLPQLVDSSLWFENGNSSSDYSPSGSSLNTPFDLPFPFDYPWSGAVPGSSDDFPEAAHTAMYNGEPLNLLEKQSRLRSPFQYSPSGSSRSSPSPSTADSQFQDITPSDGQDIFVSADDRGTFKPRRYRCPKPNCNRRFMNQYTLEVHTKSHNTKLRASYPCEMGCNEHFSRRHDRLRHEVTQHGRVCEWVCDDCGRFFSSAKTMGHHKCPVARQKTIWINSDAMGIAC